MPRSRPASNPISFHKPTGQFYVTRAGKRIHLGADPDAALASYYVTVRPTSQLPTSFEPSVKPRWMSVNRANPRQSTMFPGGESWARGQVSTQPSDGREVVRNGLRSGSSWFRHDVVQQSAFRFCQYQGGGRARHRPLHHAQPEDPPRENAVDGQQVGQSLCRPKFRFLGPAAGLDDLMKCFDLPSHRVPIEFLNGIVQSADGQVGQQLPFNPLPSFRRLRFLGIDHC